MVVHSRHDHSLRVPRPDLSVTLGTPNACTACHGDRPARWAADAVAGWLGPDRPPPPPHFGEAIHAGRNGLPGADDALARLAGDATQPGIARATAVSLLSRQPGAALAGTLPAALRDADPLVRMAAVEGLDALPPASRLDLAAPLLDDPVRMLRIDAARALAEVPPERMTAAQRAALARGLDEYRAAQRANADWPQGHMNLGVLDVALGDLAGAEREYRTALRLMPAFVPAYVNLADLYRVQGRDAEGEQLLRSGLALDPQDGDLHYALGLLLGRQRRLPEAVEMLWRAAQLRPDVARYSYAYAMALDATGERERAIAVLEAARARRPGDRELIEGLSALRTDGR
jgi:Flp pilus assembly protein TadD